MARTLRRIRSGQKENCRLPCRKAAERKGDRHWYAGLLYGFGANCTQKQKYKKNKKNFKKPIDRNAFMVYYMFR